MPKSRINKDDIREEKPSPRDEIETIAATAGRYARKMLDETHHIAEGADGVAAAIRAEPVKASLIALGVGAVIGMLLRGK